MEKFYWRKSLMRFLQEIASGTWELSALTVYLQFGKFKF